MVQQQFIISELNNGSENSSEHETSIAQNHLENMNGNGASVTESQEAEQTKITEFYVPYFRGFSGYIVSFAIFGTFRHEFALNESKEFKQYQAACQSGFRIMGMVKPDHSIIVQTILSCEGFRED